MYRNLRLALGKKHADLRIPWGSLGEGCSVDCRHLGAPLVSCWLTPVRRIALCRPGDNGFPTWFQDTAGSCTRWAIRYDCNEWRISWNIRQNESRPLLWAGRWQANTNRQSIATATADVIHLLSPLWRHIEIDGLWRHNWAYCPWQLSFRIKTKLTSRETGAVRSRKKDNTDW